MGGKKVTVGYHYELAWHDGLCLGLIDAYLAMEAGTKIAWEGRIEASSGQMINKPDLWGGEKDQGGVVGMLRVMLGGADQVPNPYLVQVFGDRTVAWRGVATVCYEGGRWGANNPYQMKRSHKVERIIKGWDNDNPWYPEKAPIPLDDAIVTTMIDPDVVLDSVDTSVDGNAGGFDFTVPPGATIVIKLGPSSQAWSFTPSDDYQPENYAYLVWWNYFAIANLDAPGLVGDYWNDRYETAAEAYAAHAGDSVQIPMPEGGNFRLFIRDAEVNDNRGAASFEVSYTRPGSVYGKNPVHIILEAYTQSYHAGLPIEHLNLDSFTAAADWYYAQGFGLGTARRPDRESPAEYSARIERVAGCSFTQSYEDGLWYIDIANGEYVLEDLPILTDDDVIEFEEIPTILDNTINSVSVKYFDPQRKESITTRPLQALALVAEFGENHQTYEFPEIPTAGIAGRVQMRELLATTTPTRAFNLVTTPKTRSWRKNTYFRAQLPKRGIADMVCMVAEGDDGKLKSGACQFKATQDVYSLPDTVYAGVEPGVDPSAPETPIPNVAEVAFEAPYIDAVAQMTPTEFAALAPDAGFVVGVAANPGGMLDFTMAVDSGGGYENKATGDYCPTCVVAAEISPGLKTGIPFSGGVRLAQVEAGSLGLWDDELVRVDGKDLVANTLDLGRGCGDTVPAKHLEGSRIFFYASGAAADPTEYTDGETIGVKLRSNTGTEVLALAGATELPVIFARRIDRPYPDGNLTLNGLPFYESTAITTTPPAGGGGGGSGGGGPALPPPVLPNGATGSTELGPHGGYPDDAPFAIPLPDPADDGDDVVGADGEFDDADVLSQYCNAADGSPLGPEWSVVDGALQYQGTRLGQTTIVYKPSIVRMGHQPMPRYSASASGDITTAGGATAGIGATPSAPHAEYEVSTFVEHTDVFGRELPGVTGSNQYFVPKAALTLVVFNPTGFMVTVRFDNLTFAVTQQIYPTTPITLDNLDFPSGLTGWVTFAGGMDVSFDGDEIVVTADTYDNFTQYFINTAPIITAEANTLLKIGGEVTCNDPTTIPGPNGTRVPSNGVAFGIANFNGTYWNYTAYMYQFNRGDRTRREWWQRGGSIDGTGTTYHAGFAVKLALNKTAKVRAITVDGCDDAPPVLP